MDCPGNSWIRVMVLENWAAFDAPYQSFGIWINGWNFLDPVYTFWHLDRNPETAKLVNLD